MLLDESIQPGAGDPEHLSRLELVPTRGLQGPHHVAFLGRVQSPDGLFFLFRRGQIQVIRPDDITFGEDSRPGQAVFQLPNVPGPVVHHEGTQGLGGEGFPPSARGRDQLSRRGGTRISTTRRR